MKRLSPKLLMLTALPLLGAAGFVALRGGSSRPTPAAAPERLAVVPGSTNPTAGQLIASIRLQDAAACRTIKVVVTGNGPGTLIATIANKTARPVRLEIPAGTILQSGHNRLAVVRDTLIEIGPAQVRRERVETAALSAGNTIAESPWQPVGETDPRLAPIFAFVRSHPEFSRDAIQTAILALTENLPMRAFARFAIAGSDPASGGESDAFRVATVEIIHALEILRAIRVPEESLALTVDPQLRIEAMIDPLAHAAAMRYYGIRLEQEWAYWKKQLLDGDPATRHYALFGIARFFPQVAVQMLPTWARETRLDDVFRTSAIQALAETQRPEAVSVLEQLAYQFGGSRSELGRTAQAALHVLQRSLKPAITANVRFRGAPAVLRPEPLEAEPPRSGKALAALGLLR